MRLGREEGLRAALPPILGSQSSPARHPRPIAGGSFIEKQDRTEYRDYSTSLLLGKDCVHTPL